jgi:very-short-patch-repair endonuclease
MGRPFSKEKSEKLNTDIKNMIMKGKSLREISNITGIKYHTIYWRAVNLGLNEFFTLENRFKNSFNKKAMMDGNLHRRKLNVSPEELRKLYWDDNLNLYEIADLFNVYPSSIFNKMTEYEIPRRNKRDAELLKYKNKPELKELARRNALNGISGYHHNKSRYSWIEQKFKKWCEENNIDAEFGYQLEKNKHRYDFYLKDYKLIVELDGIYWHSTEKQQLKDRIFELEASVAGLSLIRITDKEIKKHGNEIFEKRIREFIDGRIE